MTLSATGVERSWCKGNEGWTDTGWGEEGKARKFLKCLQISQSGWCTLRKYSYRLSFFLRFSSHSLLVPAKVFFLLLRKWLYHDIYRNSIWIYTHKTRKGMTRLCISREMRTIKMWRWYYWRWKVQKWMVGYRREVCMMDKCLDKFLSVCWEQCSCNIQVTVTVLVLLILMSPFALSLSFFFHKSSQPASGEKANWPLQPGLLLGASSCTFIQLCSAL